MNPKEQWEAQEAEEELEGWGEGARRDLLGHP